MYSRGIHTPLNAILDLLRPFKSHSPSMQCHHIALHLTRDDRIPYSLPGGLGSPFLVRRLGNAISAILDPLGPPVTGRILPLLSTRGSWQSISLRALDNAHHTYLRQWDECGLCSNKVKHITYRLNDDRMGIGSLQCCHR